MTSNVPVSGSATLTDANGQGIGKALLRQTPHGILLTLDLQRAARGVHALHIHEVGKCEPPSFESAGGHFEPSDRAHGFFSARGPHAGDLPNLHVPDSGTLSVEYRIANATLDAGPRSLLDADGSALVIHAGKDDYVSDPAGGAGERFACGVITRSTDAK